ncbi:MAG: alginate O-acetyltransferase AlgF [Alphaproteobacteria bacterium]|nr:alginate O-acetyltransferase AlgF [Alphaproteobacteria bacterium]
MKNLYLALVFLLFPLSVSANEEALYAPVPPAESAFVRAVNVSADENLSLKIDDAGFTPSEKAFVSDYAVVTQGSHNVTFGKNQKSVSLEAQKHYTLAAMADGTLKVMKDAEIENPAKAMVYFYNLSDAKAATLEAPSHKATIFENIAAGESASREINAVNFSLSVKVDGKEVGTLGGVDLKREQGTSIFLTGKGDYAIAVVTNKIAQ